MVASSAPSPEFGSEIVIGLVAAIGTDLDAPQATLTDQLRAFGYDVRPLRLSALAEVEARKLGVELRDAPECERIRTHMQAGNRLRENFERNDWLALHALAVINSARGERGGAPKPPGKTAYMVRSLKHPREVETLRQAYGPGFFLVHAEMEALLSCARNGISIAGGTLYTTTFPCHNCAKHIVDAGIMRVVYIEPYPKSRALDLHDDAIALEGEGKQPKVTFAPFMGVGPRRFVELFSLELGPGRVIERKREGLIVKWDSNVARLRAPMPLLDYLDREKAAATFFQTTINAPASDPGAPIPGNRGEHREGT